MKNVFIVSILFLSLFAKANQGFGNVGSGDQNQQLPECFMIKQVHKYCTFWSETRQGYRYCIGEWRSEVFSELGIRNEQGIKWIKSGFTNEVYAEGLRLQSLNQCVLSDKILEAQW